MDKKTTLEMIAAISDANGTSGFEDEVVAAIRSYAEGLGEITEDHMRNLYIRRKENNGIERDDERAAEIIDRIRQSGVPTLVVVNKIDLTTQEALEALVEKWRATLPDAEIIPISAREGFNIAGLFDRILALLPEGEPFYPKDTLTDKTLRFFASEIIREKILRNYDKEIPYSCEIEIEEYREEPGIDRISAVIYVARNSQKGILIGHKGEKLKKVGRQAREELEEFLRKKVFLQLFVKVSEDWRNDQRQLRRFGYDPQ